MLRSERRIIVCSEKNSWGSTIKFYVITFGWLKRSRVRCKCWVRAAVELSVKCGVRSMCLDIYIHCNLAAQSKAVIHLIQKQPTKRIHHLMVNVVSMGLWSSQWVYERSLAFSFPHFIAAIATTHNANRDVIKVKPIAVDVSHQSFSQTVQTKPGVRAFGFGLVWLRDSKQLHVTEWCGWNMGCEFIGCVNYCRRQYSSYNLTDYLD